MLWYLLILDNKAIPLFSFAHLKFYVKELHSDNPFSKYFEGNFDLRQHEELQREGEP